MAGNTQTERAYHKIVNAWCMYDWANSAFATTILAAVLPVYYSQVAGATLPSEAVATAYWSLGLSLSLLVVAVLAPILGTVSDVMRGKKRFLAGFAALGIVSTGMLILVNTGDWLLASILFVLGRIGFTSANVFYDALLPHVATEEDQDRVSARGYAMGYLGGGLLLALNVVMIQVLPGTWGPRLSFLSVALWWAIFSIPILTRVAEPPAATTRADVGRNVVAISFNRLRSTFADIRQYRELFKFLVAFLIYNDGIGTIIGVAAIYGAELGFGSVELILALLLVQFVGIPFSLIFGRLPSTKEPRRPLYLAFIVFNLVALPLVGAVGARVLPDEVVGARLPAYTPTSTAVGQGTYRADDPSVDYSGAWEVRVIPADELGEGLDTRFYQTEQAGARFTLAFNGQRIRVFYSLGPDRGIWTAELDGEPYLDEDTGRPVREDGYSATVRHGASYTFQAEEPGEHVLTLINLGEHHPSSQGTVLVVARAEILPPLRQSQLPLIIGLILALEALGLVFAWLLGRPLFARLAGQMDTKRSVILSLVVYSVIAVWGYFIDSVIEFWFLAWMVAVVQGGSQALSRSLYSSMSPAAKSGEFFGLYGIMEKFSAIIGPVLFAAAVALTGSSRPAVLSLIVFFVVGILVLTRVNVDGGRRVAREEDARAGLTRA
ncbi:MAG TPA: MFS transporter [Anaerolineae bacterium]|nr:MFS transporter [Anaerolineae bacterium]